MYSGGAWAIFMYGQCRKICPWMVSNGENTDSDLMKNSLKVTIKVVTEEASLKLASNILRGYTS